MQSVVNITKMYLDSFHLMVLFMHLQVCNFLRERGVQESVVEKFEEEKVSIWLFYTSTPPGQVLWYSRVH